MCFKKGKKKQAGSFQRVDEKKKKKRTANKIRKEVNKNERFNQHNQRKGYKNQRKARGQLTLQREKNVKCLTRRGGRGNKRQVQTGYYPE